MPKRSAARAFWVRNPGPGFVAVAHESGSGETLIVGPGQVLLVTRPELWADSHNLADAVRRGLLERGEENPPPNMPTLPEELRAPLSAHQLHTLQMILWGQEDLALSIINVRPQPEVAEPRDGLDGRTRRLLIDQHLPLLEAALWLEERRPGGGRPVIIQALRERIDWIKKLAFAEVRYEGGLTTMVT